jgi:hypothetical protein
MTETIHNTIKKIINETAEEIISSMVDDLTIKISNILSNKIIKIMETVLSDSVCGPHNYIIDEPINDIIDEPINDIIDEPHNYIIDEPINDPVSGPVNDIIDEAVNELINDIVDKPVNELINEPFNKLINDSTTKQINDSVSGPVNDIIDEIVNELINDIVDKPANELINDIVDKPVNELINEPDNDIVDGLATIVSCYYIVPNKHSDEKYDEWISNFMSLNANKVVYCDKKSHQYLSLNYPEKNNLKYVLREIDNFYINKWDWKKEEDLDFEIIRGHNEFLYKIWAEKIYFIKDTIEQKIFKNDIYCWVDIGSFRDKNRMNDFNDFPNSKYIVKEKMNMLLINNFKDNELNNITIDNRFQFVNRIGATIFAGGINILIKISSLFEKILNDFDKTGIFKGKDQTIWNYIYIQNKTLFELINADETNGYDKWFYLHYKWSNRIEMNNQFSKKDKLNIVIVGPGIMPIPPNGWGAVEILIWDYTQCLQKIGHNVIILNDKNLSNVIDEIKKIKPNIVHIQYDDYASIIPHIKDYTNIIGLTSHFGYITQKDKWSSYKYIYNKIQENCKYNNVYQFCLSNEIKNVFLDNGFPENKLFVTPNGVNNNIFRYSDNPSYPNRSIYLGKIDYRKRQYKFMNIDALYFAGNIADTNFNNKHSRYLGEWSKDILYHNLTDYGNLILLSDGEADPLVVKEAFITGLGVVISEYATANLDLTKKFIDVIPENKMNDIKYIEQIIIKNREYSIKHRDEIREYGLNFSWSHNIDNYVNLLYKLLDEHPNVNEVNNINNENKLVTFNIGNNYKVYSNLQMNNKKLNIDAVFQCYKNPYATYKCLESFKQFYPNSTIILMSDNGYNYTKMAKHFNCIYIHYDNNLETINRSKDNDNVYEWGHKMIERFKNALQFCKEDYVMWLEDDVKVNGHIQSVMKYDLNGYCPHKIPLDSYLKLRQDFSLDGLFLNQDKEYRWSGHGGSIFNRKNMLNYFENTYIIDKLLKNWYKYMYFANEIVQDLLFSMIIHLNNGTIGSYIEHNDSYGIIQHLYKEYYNKDLPNNIIELIKFN